MERAHPGHPPGSPKAGQTPAIGTQGLRKHAWHSVQRDQPRQNWANPPAADEARSSIANSPTCPTRMKGLFAKVSDAVSWGLSTRRIALACESPSVTQSSIQTRRFSSE